MPSIASPALGLLLSAAVVIAAAPARAADELPPERPTTPYRAKVRNTFRVTEPGGGKSGGDTIEIRVSGARLFEDSQIMEQKDVIVDTEQRSVIEFDPKAEDKVAARFALNDAPIPYVQGRTALAAFDPKWGPPTIAGKDRVAKHACTILHYGDPEHDGIAACVSNEGVVLRAKLVFPDAEREFEVLDFDPGEQDETWFQPPKEFRVVDGG
jgi:hypothetical protein